MEEGYSAAGRGAGRQLEWWERRQLENQGCVFAAGSDVVVKGHVDFGRIHGVRFAGSVTLGSLEQGELRDCVLEDVTLGDDVTVRNVLGGLKGLSVGDGATVENVARIEIEPEAPCGVGTSVSVLDETGSRPVLIYPGLSAQMACLMARVPKWLENAPMGVAETFLSGRAVKAEIGERAVVRDCGMIRNVSIGREACVEGARSLVNGSVVNNAAPGKVLSHVGAGVDAENFIFEDAEVSCGAIVRNCYVGQGCVISKGATAHDSLFFANCSIENGEAVAVLAGPYTVSMHKSTLLIGCQTSFMNAGSCTNQSNHMYKLGPVHWGILERGVKTSSNSYLMLGAKIGAFSLLMGSHKTHPDSSEFPFSYLFGDERGATVVVPGAMLRSCGLLRDEKKWPTRDRRLKRKLPLYDRVNFAVLNPYTVEMMLRAIDTIAELLSRPADDDLYLRYKGMKFTRASLERARHLYELAIYKYLSERLPEGKFPERDGEEAEEWVDIAGQLVPRSVLQSALTTLTPGHVEEIFSRAFSRYDELELMWIARRFGKWWREREPMIAIGASDFDAIVEDDRTEYLENLYRETKMLEL